MTGVTSTTPGAPWRPWSGATCSPRPSTSAGPPARKNGTSEPRWAATAWRACSSSSAPHASSAPSRVAAASDEPPASPAATGIRLSSRAARAGAGPGPPGQPPPTAARAAASARNTRLSAGGPASSPLTWSVSRSPPSGARLSRSARVERHEHRVERVVAVVAPADDGQRQVELGRGEADDRGEAAERVAARARHGVVTSVADGRPPAAAIGADRAERLVEGQPLPHREGLRPAVGVDAGGRERRRHPPGIERQLARQDVVDHLAALAEGRLDQAPQLVLGRRVEAVVGGRTARRR